MRQVRNIIKIDEELCNGCGECILACAEGALKIVDGKAKLIGELLCDGAGACLGHCPQGAMTIEQREAAQYDADAVSLHLAGSHSAAAAVATPVTPAGPAEAVPQIHGGCPGAAARSFAPRAATPPAQYTAAEPAQPWLSNWPVQMHLVPVSAPHYAGATVLLCADCVPFAYPEFHSDLLAGRTLIIGCPKLDDGQAYLDKLTRIIADNDIAAVEVAFMEVPCCFGMVALARKALAASGKNISARAMKIGIGGELLGSAKLDQLP